MKKLSKLVRMKIFRTIVQIIFFILLPGLVGAAFLEIKLLFADIVTGNFMNILPDCALFIVLSVLTMITGRFFCGWMCMFGAYNDWVNIIGTKVFKNNYRVSDKADKYLKLLKYVVLVFITTLVWTSIVKLPSGSSPWDAIMQLSNPSYAFSNYLIGILILLGITIGDFFIERFFCRYLCPLGAVFSIFSKLRVINIQKNRNVCDGCSACSYTCPMHIDLNDVDVVRSGECIQCFNCVSICPKDNAKVTVNKKIANEYLVASIAVAGTTGLYLGTDKLATNGLNSSYSSQQTTNSTKYADGTYIGTGTGYRPNLKVSVTIKNDKITDIEVYSSNETANFFNKAWSTIKSKIISSQSTNVSTVSGATRSSNGIIEAVNDALDQAEEANKNASTTELTTNAVSSSDTNKATTSSANSSTSNTNAVSSSNTSKTTTSSASNSNSNTNAVSSSDTNKTTTSSENSSTSTNYKDGTYIGTGTGYRPNLKLSVTISGGKITDIQVYSSNETENFFQRAWSTIKSKIISSQSTNVSTVSGATRSSNGIIAAVKDALAQAKA